MKRRNVSPTSASSSSAASSLTYTWPSTRLSILTSPPETDVSGPNPRMNAGSMPTMLARPSLRDVLAFTTGADSPICGRRPSMVSRSASSPCSWTKRSKGKYGELPRLSSASASVETMISSTVFRDLMASWRMEKASVSPVPNADAIMTVLSMTPMMIRAVCPRLRGMLRSPILSIIRLRHARTTTTAMAARNMPSSTGIRMFIESPNISSIRRPPPVPAPRPSPHRRSPPRPTRRRPRHRPSS